jgi:ABC-type lipoprotein export system ATPase subunit
MLIVDTPGIGTGLGACREHDATALDAILRADVLVYVVTSEGFDNLIAEEFKRLIIDRDKAGETILVVNKMMNCADGNTPEQRAIIEGDLAITTSPYSPRDLNVVYIDAKAHLRSVALEKKTVESLLEEESLRLTNLRRTSASTLENKIQQELFNLNFSDVLVSVDFKEKKEYSPDGRDDVEFLISTNKGERLKPLNKIASGGEMSRIMLAFKMIIADFDNIPTMIFDEIDAGISGETAVLVGKAIKQLGETRQVITITHLPQIAAYGDHNYRISKTSDDSSTYTTITQLSDHEKAGEVARLIAGLNISDLTLQNAMEMINMTKMR